MSTRPSATPFPIVAWIDRRSPAQKRVGLTLIVLAGLFVVARVVAGITIDFWWFPTITDSSVWETKLTAQLALALLALVVGGVVVLGSALVARRSRPAKGNKPNRLVSSYRMRMGPAHGWLLVGGAILVTLRGAGGAMNHWQQALLFANGTSLGTPAPDIGWDIGYHLFRLPFLGLASGWLRLTLVYGLGFAVFGYVANGALKIPRAGHKSSRRAVVHLAAGVAALCLLQALNYIFVSLPGLATARFGAFDGAGFTQLRVIVPALWVLAGVAVFAAIMTVRATVTRRWRPAVVTFGVWAALQVVLLFGVPWLVNRFVVTPAEATLQLPYIANNLEATRSAYSLSSVEQSSRVLADGIDAPPGSKLAGELNTVPLFSAQSLVSPLQVLKGTTGTRITDVDLDRYEIDGVRRPVFIAARNSRRADLPEKGWVQEHLVYTHGDGVVIVPADSTSPDGRPDVDAFTGALAGVRPELYFGENLAGWYVIVGTDLTEVGGVEFSGNTAIDLSGFWPRLALALTTGEVDPLVSAELGDASRLLYRRDIVERIGHLAPFLAIDGNPYPVVADGRIVWIVDAYTTSSSYPYSQHVDKTGLSGNGGVALRAFNYLHASIKATVDAYDGSVHLYRTEVGGADDPILDAWDAIFPGLIEPISEMPADLRAHLLYPQDMLTVQTTMLGRYHVSDAETLFSGIDSWAISVAVGDGVVRPSSGTNDQSRGPSPVVSLFMPTSEPLGGHWVAIRPYGPGSSSNPTSTRDELSALAIADHDDPEHLILTRIEVDSGRLISSPSVAQAAIDTDDDLAAAFTLLNANGSAVQFGPMTPIPLEDALVWARSIVVTGTASTTAPSLYGVAAVSNGLVGQAATTAEALATAVERSAALRS